MKRTTLVFLLVALLLVSGNTLLFANEPVTISLLHGWTGTRGNVLEKCVREFEEAYPWIKVDMSLVLPNHLAEKITVTTLAGTPFDVMMTGGNDFDGWDEAFLTLDQFIAQDGLDLEQLIYPFAYQQIKSYTDTGELKYIPLIAGVGYNILYINEDLFGEAGLDSRNAPTTWRELALLEPKLQVGTGTELTQVGLGIVDRGTLTSQVSGWLQSAGEAGVYSYDGEKVSFNVEGVTEVLSWMIDYMESFYAGWPGLQDIYRRLAPGNQSAEGLFRAGRAGMVIAGEWVYFQAKSELKDPNLSLSVRPSRELGQESFIATPAWGYGISSLTRHPLESWLLLQWLTLNADQVANFLEPQFRPAVFHPGNMEMLGRNPDFEFFVDVLTSSEWAGPSLPVEIRTELDQIVNSALQTVFFERVSAQGALEEAVRLAKVVLDYYGVRY